MIGGMGIVVVKSVDLAELRIDMTTKTRPADATIRVIRMAIANTAFIFDSDFGSPSTLPVGRIFVKDSDMLAVDMTDATSSGIAARRRVVDVHKSLVFGPHG